VNATLPCRIKFLLQRNCLTRLSWCFICGFILLSFFFLFNHSIYAQVQVTGHVFAEIIEPIALSPKAFNNHELTASGTDCLANYVIAEIKIKCRQDMNVDVAVLAGNLVSPDEKILPFNAFAYSGCFDGNQDNLSGEKSFTLKAIPGEMNGQNSIFCGVYSVMFMYD
jgi:hypothetical protein